MRFASVAALAGLAGSLLLAPGVADAAPAYHRYVALGDSYAAVGTLTDIDPHPIGCARSRDNYPGDVAKKIAPAAFVDISCGGATTADMTSAQSVPLGSNPAQFSALTHDTDLVSVTIGGNDVGFISILADCAVASVTNPVGAPCKAKFTAGGVDELAARVDAVAPKIDAVLAGIKSHSPNAKIVVVGYLRILPPSGGCWPVVPVAAGDVPYLDGVEHRLNATIGASATAAGATFVDPGETTGHDVCQAPADKWVEGLLPTSLSVPVHPNATGQAHVADLVAAALS